MFSGNSTVSFKSGKKKPEILNIIQENLESALGSVEITEKGQIIINAKRFDGFAHTVCMDGFIREKEGRYTVEINYETNANILFWIILVVGLFIMFAGVFVFIFPFIAKNDIKTKVDKALDSLRFEFN
jgi:hypothetical protein